LLATADDHASHAHHQHHDARFATGVSHHHESPDSKVPGGGHDHRAWSTSHCAFAAVATAPPTHSSDPVVVALTVTTLPERQSALPVAQRHRFLIAQPRAPPALA
jgi:hypothetical protein